MLTREMNPTETQTQGRPGEGPPTGQNLQAAQVAGQRLLNVGANIISRTLTGQSERFNQAMQQEGGQ